MKLLILQEKLKEGLNAIERIVSKSLSLPVLNNVLIRADKNFLNLVATNLEIGINWWTLAKVEKKRRNCRSCFPSFRTFLSFAQKTNKSSNRG